MIVSRDPNAAESNIASFYKGSVKLKTTLLKLLQCHTGNEDNFERNFGENGINLAGARALRPPRGHLSKGPPHCTVSNYNALNLKATQCSAAVK